ncbi:MAG: hypothetical protein HY769_09375 [Candidatus Stahlbacteria bacterium]|nr:hypothetical protein [Candidatus Stahlbacteria bacterium]
MLILFLLLISVDVQKTIDFAHYLYKTGNYKSAITEYERAIFIISQDTCSSKIDTFSLISQIGKSYLFLGESDIGRKYLNKVSGDTSSALIGFSMLEEGKLLAAKKEFSKIMNKAWQSKIETHYSKLLTLPHKSPLVAGLLSTIVPGSGRIYSNRWGDGVFAFLFTVGSFALAHHYYSADNHIAAIGFSGLGVLFYLGDIYGSCESAKLYNEKVFYEELDKFKLDFGYIY